jgi:hypothetical protein
MRRPKHFVSRDGGSCRSVMGSAKMDAEAWGVLISGTSAIKHVLRHARRNNVRVGQTDEEVPTGLCVLHIAAEVRDVKAHGCGTA